MTMAMVMMGQATRKRMPPIVKVSESIAPDYSGRPCNLTIGHIEIGYLPGDHNEQTDLSQSTNQQALAKGRHPGAGPQGAGRDDCVCGPVVEGGAVYQDRRGSKTERAPAAQRPEEQPQHRQGWL